MADWAGRFYETTYALPGPGPARVYDLAQPLTPGMPRHPHHPPYAFVLTKKHGEWSYPNGITAASELITTGGHVGTHIDALGHIACDGEIHGGHAIEEAQSYEHGLQVGSVEEIPPILAPAHLIDAVKLFGRDPTPDDGIGPSELERWFSDHAPPGPGSVVLVRTGWIRYWNDAQRYIGLETGLPGVNRAGAEWLSARGIVAAGSDTMNFEHKVAGVVSLSVHVHLLVERGIYIMESLNLERLAQDGVTDFAFYAVPLRLRGATGSPIRPVAVVGRR